MRRVILAFGAAVLLAIVSFDSVAADGLGPPDVERLPATASGNVPTDTRCRQGSTTLLGPVPAAGPRSPSCGPCGCVCCTERGG